MLVVEATGLEVAAAKVTAAAERAGGRVGGVDWGEGAATPAEEGTATAVGGAEVMVPPRCRIRVLQL